MPTTTYDAYKSIDLDTITTWVATRRTEDLWLEFKELRTSPGLKPEDRKRFAIAVSAFANSDGGLIVWGVSAKKGHGDALDGACEKCPISGVDVVLSEFLSLTGQATSPAVEGVEHRVVRESNGDGYIITYVPRSESGPHMAKHSENRYYRRSGSSKYVLEHFDLEDMFGRRPKPKLEITSHVSRMSSSLRGDDIGIVIGVRNVGRGIAKFPFLKIIVPDVYTLDRNGLDGNYGHGWRRRPDLAGLRPPEMFYGGANDVIHPEDEQIVTRLLRTCHPANLPPDLTMFYWVGAEGMAQSGSVLHMGGGTIRTAIDAAKQG